MSERSNAEAHWDEFCDWCASLEGCIGDPREDTHTDDWLPWWECWNAALDAREAHDAEEQR